MFAGITWTTTGMLLWYEGHRLLAYLRDNHTQFFEKTTYSSRIRFNLRSIPFLFSKDDLGDQKVNFLKSNFKRLIAFTVTQFLTFPALFLIVIINKDFVRNPLGTLNH
jgi:hypothetical protein